MGRGVENSNAKSSLRNTGFSFTPLPEPGEKGVWHFLAANKKDPIGTLSVIDTTHDRQLHERCRLSFGVNGRVVRYAQLAILKSYRNRGILKMPD